MRSRFFHIAVRRAAVVLCAYFGMPSVATAQGEPPEGPPRATIDLTMNAGAQSVQGTWRFHDARIVETAFRAPGADGQPTGVQTTTYDIAPRAGGADYDDSTWIRLEPETLHQRRGTGRLSFVWYRIRVTVPERVGAFDPTGSTVVFDTSLDDYAEVWVDGEIERAPGQRGGSVVAGWNASNRVVIGRDVRPGQSIQLAVFGMNGPLSDPPTNFIWVRHARLEFYEGATAPYATTPTEVNVEVVRNDPGMDTIVGPNPKIHKLADGFKFTEGPVWRAQDGTLLLSDPNSNVIYAYDTRAASLSVYRTPSGYSGADIARYRQPGSNGLALDPRGQLTINEHGNRRVVRLDHDGRLTVLADRYRGKRLNSPNDLAYRSDGALFFTDPPFGLPAVYEDPAKELQFSGVYVLHRGELRLLTKEMKGPNGIALSPDERYLYVGNWDEERKIVMRYEVQPDGNLKNGMLFYDMTTAAGEDAIDGVKVDVRGNVYVSGPGGLWVFSSDGRHLGTIRAPKHIHNMAWGGDDGRTLFLCARSALYAMRLEVSGIASPDVVAR